MEQNIGIATEKDMKIALCLEVLERRNRQNGYVVNTILTGKYIMKEGEVGMTYKRGQVSISVHQLDGFGKNPSLWIGTDEPNQLVKVASFSNEDKAKLFCKWLEYLIGFNNDEGSAKWN